MTSDNHSSRNVNRRRFLGAMGTVGAGVMAGCLGGDEPEVRTEIVTVEGEERTVVRTVEAQPGEEGLPDEIQIGESSPVMDVNNFPLWPTLEDNLAAEGITLDADVFSGHSATAGGLIQGDILTGFMSLPALISARNEGLPLVGIHGRMQVYEQPLVGAEGIDEFADLEGKRVAIHDPNGASATIGYTMALEEFGSIDAIEWEFILGSGNRVAAMESGEIDGTIVVLGAGEYLDYSGTGSILAYPWDFEGLENAFMNQWVVLEPQLEEQEVALQAFVDHMQTAYDYMYEGDIDEIIQGVVDYGEYPDYDADVWANGLEAYREAEVFPPSKAESVPQERIEHTQDVLVDAGLLDEDETRPYDDLIDRRFLE